MYVVNEMKRLYQKSKMQAILIDSNLKDRLDSLAQPIVKQGRKSFESYNDVLNRLLVDVFNKEGL